MCIIVRTSAIARNHNSFLSSRQATRKQQRDKHLRREELLLLLKPGFKMATRQITTAIALNGSQSSKRAHHPAPTSPTIHCLSGGREEGADVVAVIIVVVII